MLQVSNLTMAYPTPEGTKRLFDNLSFSLEPGERLAVMGRNGQGKSTLIKILGGVVFPTGGSVIWNCAASWPIGFAGAFQGSLTGLDNIRFVARIHGRPIAEIVDKTESFAELGAALRQPVKQYSSGMRARLAFGLSLAIEFDAYLIDEVIAVGDAGFQRKCELELFGTRGSRAFVIASHDLGFLQTHCTRAIILDEGRAKLFDDIDLAVGIYAALAAKVTVEETVP